MIKALIFDWGDTIMRDFPGQPGPMYTWPQVKWIPGAKKVLEYYSKRCPLIIATNAGESDTKDMIRALDRIDATRYFSHFFSSRDLGYAKPDPRFFLAICSLTSFSPDECVMTGNMYDKDIVGARKCGMHTVWYNENRIQGEFPDAEFEISRMDELTVLDLA